VQQPAVGYLADKRLGSASLPGALACGEYISYLTGADPDFIGVVAGFLIRSWDSLVECGLLVEDRCGESDESGPTLKAEQATSRGLSGDTGVDEERI
jgi:hypothetical protein